MTFVRETPDRLKRAVAVVLVGVAPALLLFCGVARFMIKHFFVHAPYLLDTGMLSGLAYRDGLLLPMRKITCEYVTHYYDVYFSPLTSLFSLASYLAPVDRITWYVFVQSLIYVPIGLAVFVAARRLEPETVWRRLPITVVAALAFAFSGPVFWMVPYPHFEAAMPGLTCLVLAALVTGRMKVAWVCLALAVSVRQDGGIHLAMAMSPLVLLRWRGVPMPPSLRRLIAMCAVAVGLSVVGMLSIRLFFTPYPRLAQAYLGSPLYSHLSVDLLVARVHGFIESNQIIYYPFLATCLIAAARRDLGYLLGWASTVPWFCFCFLAREEVKAGFWVYSIGPFMIGMFWVYLYGAFLARRRMRAGVAEALLALVCVASTLGAYRGSPGPVGFVARDMLRSRLIDRGAVYRFIGALRDHRDRFGELRVDGSVATLGMEYLADDPARERWYPGAHADTLAFHRLSADKDTIVPGLLANGLDTCTHVINTGLVMCTRQALSDETFEGAPVEHVAATFALVGIPYRDRRLVSFESRGVVIHRAYTVRGQLGKLPARSYEWTVTLDNQEPARAEAMARLRVNQGARAVFATADFGAKTLTLRFSADGGELPVQFELATTSNTPVVIASSRVQPAQ